VLPNTGHWIPEERPKKTTEALVNFSVAIEGDLSRCQIAVKEDPSAPQQMRARFKQQRRKRLWQKGRSPINGVGLFAALPIRAVTPIIEFKGRVIPWEEGAVMLLRGANHVIKFDARHDLDARPQWSPAGHVNHGCYPNCAIKKKRDSLWLTSIRSIEQHEELLIDYGYELGEEFEPCRCGHPRCRGLMLRRKDWPKLRRLIAKAKL